MKIALISGASSGIGRAITKELDCKELDELWLIATRNELLVQLASELNTKTRLFALDLTAETSIEIIKNALEESLPTVSYLICSAGVGYNGTFDAISDENISAMIGLNCLALTRLTKYAMPYLSQGSRVIEIASGAGFAPQPGFSVYSATKSYVISLSRALNYELKGRKISVTAVCPGPVDTKFFSSLENVKDYKKKFLISPEKVAKKTISDADKGRPLSIPSFSMKMFHFASKILPTSLLLKFYK